MKNGDGNHKVDANRDANIDSRGGNASTRKAFVEGTGCVHTHLGVIRAAFLPEGETRVGGT